MVASMADLNGHDADAGRRPLIVRAAAILERAATILADAGDLLVPAACVACRSPLAVHHALCPDCWGAIDFIRPPLCDRLGLPMPYDPGGPIVSARALADPPEFDRARAVGRFAGVLRELVQGLKYSDELHGARLFGRLLAVAAADLLPGTDLIVAMPLARARLWRRRYNQAAVLADALSRRCRLAHDPLALERFRATATQVGLTRTERRKNVDGAFRVPARRARRIEGRNILLVDDVMTSGATAEAAARALKKAGAARVDVVVLGLVTDALAANA